MNDFWNSAFLLPGVVFIVILLTYYVVRRVIMKRQVKLRIASIKEKREGHEHVDLLPSRTKRVTLRQFIQEPLEKLREANKKAASKFKLQFEQCGWNPQLAPILVPIVKFVGIFLFIFFFEIINTTVPQFMDLPFVIKGVIFIIFIFLGFRSFEYTTDIFKKMRYAELKKSLAMVLDLLVVCTRAGLSLDKSFERIAQEIAYLAPVMAKELAIISAELSILPNRRTALENFSKRVALPLVRSITIALIQAEEQGVSIGQTLQVLSQEYSKQKLLELEAKAAKLPATLTVPMILFSLPVLFIIILGPGVSKMLENPFFDNLVKK
jgi:tight adherence protein C